MAKRNIEILNPVKELANSVDLKTVNTLLAQTQLADFEMNKSTITNIAEWCLNGDSDAEIRKKLSLTKDQWAILVTVCPTLLLIMKDTRALADVVVAGSLFQTAIGGKTIRKQQLVRVKEYNEKGLVSGEHYIKEWVEEELPPNPMLLKYLAEHKMSEKLGDNMTPRDNNFKKMVESLTPEERAMIEAMKKAGDVNAN